jgi:uncharacterized protein
MRLVLDSDPKIHTIRSYAPGEIVVGEQVLRGPCVVSAAYLLAEWAARSAAALDESLLAPLLELRPSVILLGVLEGRPPAPRPLVATLQRRGVSVETMNLGAACRTYNVLAHEGRAVVAGLFPV